MSLRAIPRSYGRARAFSATIPLGAGTKIPKVRRKNREESTLVRGIFIVILASVTFASLFAFGVERSEPNLVITPEKGL